jgi:hypothetical protein
VEEAGGEAAGSVLADSCFAQAVSISAATSALRASLVFINRYPKRSKSGVEKIRTNLVVPRVPVRIAAINSIDSPADLKQLEALSVLYDSGRRSCLSSPYNGTLA